MNFDVQNKTLEQLGEIIDNSSTLIDYLIHFFPGFS